MSDEEKDVTLVVEDHVATITIERAPVNAFSVGTWDQLREALESVRDEDKCSVVVIRSGLEKFFSAGADVKEKSTGPDHAERRQRLSRHVLELVLRFPVPVIASVSGAALGAGCALTSVCDMRFASEDASFGLPEINAVRAGGGRYLMRVLPQGPMRQAYFTGRPISAHDAWRLGMVNELLPDKDALDAAVKELASVIVAKSPTALKLAKQSLDLVENLSISAGYEVEQQFTLRLVGTPDAAEAAAAFAEKRPPVWPSRNT